MTRRYGPRAGVAPTAQQRLLLRAALLEGDRGREAWEQWRRQVDLDRLDAGSQRLLPQLYRNVRPYATGEPLLERLKGVYRHTWSANGVLFRDTGRLLRALGGADVPTVVLDGTVLVPLYCRDYGARPVDSIAIMIPPDQVPRVSSLLAAEGWGPPGPVGLLRPSPYTSQARLLGGGRPVDLLWDPFPEGCAPDIRRAYWAAAEPTELAGVPCLRFAPTDELLRTCVRAARWEEIPPFRRLADALMLLRGAASHVDWDRLVRHAVRAHVILPVLTSLSLLREVLDAPVPAGTLQELRSIPVGAAERVEQRLREAPRPRLGRLPDLLFRYRRLTAAEHAGAARPGLSRYLQDAWGVRRPWLLPVVALGKGIRRALRPDRSDAAR